MKRLLSTVVALGLGGALPAHAQGVPTLDLSSVSQQIQQLEQMLQDFGIQSDMLANLREQLAAAQEQFAKLEEIRGVLTGERDILDVLMGGELDNLLGAEFTNIAAAIEGVQRGDFSALAAGPNAGPLREGIVSVLDGAGFDAETLERMAAGNPSGEPDDGEEGDGDDGPGSVDEEAQRIAAQATGAATMSAAAQITHENAGVAAERIETLMAAIPDQADLKASIDHNTRVTAELGIILLEMLQLQSVATVGAGQAGVIDAATVAAEREFIDFTMPEFD